MLGEFERSWSTGDIEQNLAELYYLLGKREEGDALFEKMLEEILKMSICGQATPENTAEGTVTIMRGLTPFIKGESILCWQMRQAA